MTGIYAIINQINGKMYIGESTHLENRYVQHFSNLRRKVHCNQKLQNAFNKYGEECFTYKILEQCSDEERFEKEIEYIAKYDTFENGYNLTPGGDGPNKGQFSGQNNPMYGKNGESSPAFKDYIYQITLDGEVINKYASSCLAAEALLGVHIERGARNSKGLCSHIITCCNNWKENSTKSFRATASGFQWIREQDYIYLQNKDYDFSIKRSKNNHKYPITEFQNEGALNGDVQMKNP